MVTIHYVAVNDIDVIRRSVYLILLYFLLTNQQVLHRFDNDDEIINDEKSLTASEAIRAPITDSVALLWQRKRHSLTDDGCHITFIYRPYITDIIDIYFFRNGC